MDGAEERVSIQPARLRDLLSTFDLFSLRTRERGSDYAGDGRVLEYESDETRIQSKVVGGKLYETEWQWYEGEWDCACSCPVEVYCKHAYAVALRVLADARSNGFDDPRLAALLPTNGDHPAASSDSGDETWEGEDEDAVPIVLLRDSPLVWQRESALDELLAGSPVVISPYGPGFAEILEEEDADVRCWSLAQKIAGEAGGWLPADLEPYRDREDLRARHSGQQKDSLVEDLLAWAGERPTVPRRRLRLAFSLRSETPVSASVVFEVQATTTRLRDAGRNLQQLQQIRAESRRDAAALTPEHASLLEWILSNCAPSGRDGGVLLSTPRLATLLEWVAEDTATAVWAREENDAGTAGGVQGGQPLRIGRELLRLVPAIESNDGKPVVSLAVAWPDGRQRKLDEGLLFIEPLDGVRGLLLCDGVFHWLAEPPPALVLVGFGHVGQLALDDDGRDRALHLLTSRFPTVATALSEHTRVHSVQAIVAFDLRDDDWLHARVFACRKGDAWQPGESVPASSVVFEWSAETGWSRMTGDSAGAAPGYAEVAAAEANGAATATAPQPSTDVWLEIPDAKDVAPALAWLEGVPMRPEAAFDDAPEDEGGGWWMKATQARMNDLAEAWLERPRGVRIVGTTRVQRLLTGHRRVRPRLRIRKSGIDWFAVSAELEAEGQMLSAEQIRELRRSSARFVKLGTEWVSKEALDGYDQSNVLLADLGLDADGEEQRLSFWQLAGAARESLEALLEMGADEESIQAVQALRDKIDNFEGIPGTDPPGTLVETLRDYQRHGFDFLVYAGTLGLAPVLADDMGLGKTLQALAWIQHLVIESPQGGPTLVVCPASVVHVWQREAERFTPDLKVLILGRGRERFAQWDQIAGADLVVTNYALLRRDIERWKDVELRAYVLDEAQNIKNPDTAIARATRMLVAEHRLALTGTPLENRPLDVWSIVSCLNPGYLGTRAEFQDRFGNPEHPEAAYKLLSAKLRPIMLRRTKDQVAPELPERFEQRHECELTAGQRRLYMAELRRSREQVFDLADDENNLRRNRVAVLAALTRLRQICCHPALIGADAALGSGKFDTVFALLEELIAEGHKVLLFSQFVQCLKLLEKELVERQMSYHVLTGSTRNREEVVSAFQESEDASIFLISLKAGGTGLNLTSASYVILFDPWWNPAVEAQAIDRTHRIGQKRAVMAYRLATRGTIEDKIWELQKRKAKMLEHVLSEKSFAGSLTKEDLAYLLDNPEESGD